MLQSHDPVPWFYVVLPDHPDAARVADQVTRSASLVVDHPSGRPWLMCRMPARRLVVAREPGGARAVALIGRSSADRDDLLRVLDRMSDVSGSVSVTRSFAGSYALACRIGERYRIQGTATGVHRVFRSTIDGVPVVSDRADVLAGLGSASGNRLACAVHLVQALPVPVNELPMWQGVHGVPPGHCLDVQRRGERVHTTRWWTPPEPVHTLHEGGRHLRRALDAAVSTRTRGAQAPVGADLSGGLDSTPVAWFAARSADVVATTAFNDDPGGRDDLAWARIALTGMPGVRHRTEHLDDLPDFFGGLPDLTEVLDDPSPMYVVAPRIRPHLAFASALGSDLHLNGFGGDQLFAPRAASPGRNRGGRRTATGSRPWRRRSGRATEAYRAWLKRAIRPAAEPSGFAVPPGRDDWAARPTFPPWLGRDAGHEIVRYLDGVADTAEPLSGDIPGHLDLVAIREGGRMVRSAMQLGSARGVEYESPLFDDQVVEACLRVPHALRRGSLEFKPLIKSAMHGLLPEESLRRNSKSGGSRQAVEGLRRNYPAILEMCRESPLVETGIIDFECFARVMRPDPVTMPNLHALQTLSSVVHARVHGEVAR